MKLNPDIVFRQEPDGTGLLFNPRTGKVMGLNETAVLILKKINEGALPEEIVDFLSMATGAHGEEIRQDVQNFTKGLQEKNLIFE